jgi:hypothetical protein
MISSTSIEVGDFDNAAANRTKPKSQAGRPGAAIP